MLKNAKADEKRILTSESSWLRKIAEISILGEENTMTVDTR